MTNLAKLKARKHKDLAQMARQKGIAGWHAMRKSQLVEALLNSHKLPRARTAPSAKNSRPTAAQRRIRAALAERERYKDLTTASADQGIDRLILMVRDPYWLHATWQVTDKAVERARAALAENWHAARPILRLFRIPTAGIKETQPAEVVVRDIDIHGAVNSWFIDVADPPTTFRAEIGYLARNRDFRSVARSNLVTTPSGTATGNLEEFKEVVEDAERILALSGGYHEDRSCDELREYLEERLNRPLGGNSAYHPAFGRSRNGAAQLEFSVDAEMVVFGTAASDARVTMDGEPVDVNSDGSFSIRVHLAERRQVLPIVATTGNGREERTVIIAVERNTKVLEPRIRERV